MQVQSINLKKIKGNSGQIDGLPSNPRLIKDEKYKKLVQSLRDDPEMLQLRELIVYPHNGDYIAIAGNMRLKALQELGHAEAPCKVLAEDTPIEKLKAYTIKDNIGYGEHDWDLIANEWDAEQLTEWGLDIPDFKVAAEAEEDDFDTTPPAVAKTVLGDLYELNEHRVHCADSTDSDAVGKLMNGVTAELIYTDPPYSSGGSQESGKTSGSIGARGGKEIKNDNLSTRGYRLLMDDVLALHQNCHSVFIFCDWKMWIETFDLAERAGYRVRNMLVWDKMQMGMGMPFRNQHELCLFASKIAGKIGDGKTANVLPYKRDREAEHATPKPIVLIADMLKQVGSANVFDPFLGGGSTLIASEQLGRICYGQELDPKYCDVIVRRWVKYMKEQGKPYTVKRNGQDITHDDWLTETEQK